MDMGKFIHCPGRMRLRASSYVDRRHPPSFTKLAFMIQRNLTDKFTITELNKQQYQSYQNKMKQINHLMFSSFPLIPP